MENTVKAVRRGQTISEESIEKLYDDIIALYRLDQIGAQNSRISSDMEESEELPTISVLLLVTLATVWACMILYVAVCAVKRRIHY